MNKCPTCGQLMPPAEFRVGDVVRHMNDIVGEVVSTADAMVKVRFESKKGHWFGLYDAAWFEMHPLGLTKVAASPAGGSKNEAR